MSGSVNPWHGEPPTGEPYAGEPHVRFGGRGDRVINRSSLPLSVEPCFNPRPRVGGDHLSHRTYCWPGGFNPRPRVGGDGVP